MKNILMILIVCLFSYWSLQPILSPGFYSMHDDTQIARVVVMGNALREGQFPVRLVSDLGYGYGYPLYNFYGPLPYYIGGMLNALGIKGLYAAKLMIGLGIVLTGITMYFFSSTFVGRLGGLVAAVFYLYAPYHAVDIYVRGAIGESWALVFIPIFLLGIFLCHKNNSKGIIIGSIGMSGIILSHTILGYISTLFFGFWLILYAVIKRKEEKFRLFVRPFIFLMFIGLALSAFFWLPALTEMKYTSVSGQIDRSANFRDHFVCINELWNSPWGFAGSAPGCIDGMSFTLGKLHIIIALFVVFYYIYSKNRRSIMFPFIKEVFAISIVSVFFLLPVSRPIWELVPYFSYIQYPWRFISFTIIGLSFLSGCIILFCKKKIQRIIVSGILIFLVIFANAKWFKPKSIYQRPLEDFETHEELRFRVSKISDEYLPKEFVRPLDSAMYSRGTIQLPAHIQADIETDIETAVYAKFFITLRNKEDITIQRVYFPGWKYYIDGREVKPKIIQALPVVSVSEGKHTLELRFTNTPIRTLANIISMFMFILLLIIYGKKGFS